MANYFAQNGISHLTSPPHTPEHNGFAERRHRHIVEIGLALLSHSSIPHTYWPYALSTATYLINRLPTPTLDNSSPFEILFCHPPNYTKLRVFGCLCYPWLRPYNKHKLESRSTPCIFLGYSPTQSAYLCLEPSSNCIYTSRHVVFHETTFPYSSLLQATKTPTSSTLNTQWLSQVSLLPCLSSSPPVAASPNVSSSPQSLQEITATSRHEENAMDPNLEACFDTPSGLDTMAQSPYTASQPTTPTNLTTSLEPQVGPHTDSPSSLSTSPPHVVIPNEQPPPPNPPTVLPQNQHNMKTRAKNNIYKPSRKFSLLANVVNTEVEPTSVTQALNDKLWRQSMSVEFDAQLKNRTWNLVPPNPTYNLVGSRWVFRIKRLPNGNIDKYKSRLVAKGFHQRPSLDFTETYSPVIKPASARLLLGHAVSYAGPYANWMSITPFYKVG